MSERTGGLFWEEGKPGQESESVTRTMGEGEISSFAGPWRWEVVT